jgi:very-short-patch-repair endonuclease
MSDVYLDEYIYATALAKDHGKEVKHWLENAGTKKAIKAVESEILKQCVIKRQGGNFTKQGTWIHNKLLPYFQQWLNVHSIRYEFKKDETEFKLLLESTFKDLLVFEYQKKVDNYYLDFYNEKYNLVIEYDETHHNNVDIKDNDIKREQYLIAKLNCTIIRVKQGEEFQGINQIIKFMMENKINE